MTEVEGDSQRYQQKRRAIAFERVPARLVAEDPNSWLLKGGVALDYRLRDARSTADLDLSARIDLQEFSEKLVRALNTDLNDLFEVRISGAPFRPVDEVETYRFDLDVRLNNKTFVRTNIDVGFADPWIGDADSLTSETLAFAGAQPVVVSAISVEQHIAEKLHAYTKTYNGRPSSRVKDFVDLVLLLNYRPISSTRLSFALEAIFDIRSTHKLPSTLPAPPAGWKVPYQRLSETLPISPDISAAFPQVESFFNPVLGTSTKEQWWNPQTQSWTEDNPALFI